MHICILEVPHQGCQHQRRRNDAMRYCAFATPYVRTSYDVLVDLWMPSYRRSLMCPWTTGTLLTGISA